MVMRFLPYVSEYKENRIALNTNSFSNNIEIDNAVKSVVLLVGPLVRSHLSLVLG